MLHTAAQVGRDGRGSFRTVSHQGTSQAVTGLCVIQRLQCGKHSGSEGSGGPVRMKQPSGLHAGLMRWLRQRIPGYCQTRESSLVSRHPRKSPLAATTSLQSVTHSSDSGQRCSSNIELKGMAPSVSRQQKSPIHAPGGRDAPATSGMHLQAADR